MTNKKNDWTGIGLEKNKKGEPTHIFMRFEVEKDSFTKTGLKRYLSMQNFNVPESDVHSVEDDGIVASLTMYKGKPRK